MHLAGFEPLAAAAVKPTHRLSGALRVRLSFVRLPLGTQRRDGVGLQPDRAGPSRVYETLVFEMLAADGDVGPGRFFKTLPVDRGEKLDPLQPPLRILR